MKPVPVFTGLVLAALAAGIFAGRQFATGRHDREDSSAPEATKDPSRATVGKLPGGKSHDLGSLLRLYRLQLEGEGAVSRGLERLGTGALKELIGELVTDLRFPFDPQQRESWELMRMAMEEIYRRDGEKALEWANEAQSSIRRYLMIYGVMEAARESPEIARAWSQRFQNEFGTHWARSAILAAIQGATARGAEDLIRLKELYGADLQVAAFPQGEFAEGFDFKRLVTALPVDSSMGNAVQRWVAADKEAAWNGIRGMDDAKALPAYFSSLFLGVAAMEGDKKAAKWIAGKIDQIPEAERKAAFFTLVSTAQGSPSDVAALMAALPRESDRLQLATGVIFPNGDHGLGLAALQNLGSPTAQTEALLAVAATYGPGMGYGGTPHYNMVHGYFDTTMEELDLPPEARERIKAALVPPARGEDK